jgi:hypothetical protein
MKYAIIEQGGGLGDIFFLQKAIDSLLADGWNIIWPVSEYFLYLSEYIKKENLKFYSMSEKYPFKEYFNISEKEIKQIQIKEDIVLYIPFGSIPMKEKYLLLNIQSNGWVDNFIFDRNLDREILLKNKYNIKDGEEFIYVNDLFASPPNMMKRNIVIKTDKKIVYNDGESCHIFDYCWILENAKELHLVESATCYLVEKLNTTDKLFMYSRKINDRPQHPDFRYVDHVYKKNWISVL